MKYMKSLVFICLLICLFSIASVCASDINETVVANEDQSDDIITVENQDTSDVGTAQAEELSTSPGTFTELANEIANAGDELNLTRNYIYNLNDVQYKRGICIEKKIIINGNGFSLDANQLSCVFNISENNIVLKNILFVNCSSSDNGGAVYWGGNHGSIYNCSFIKCCSLKSSSKGGAVYFEGVNCTVNSCNFVDCYSLRYGGAVYFEGVNCTVDSSCFENCHASYIDSNARYGGAVYWNGINGTLKNCSFLKCYLSTSDNSITHRGGAVYWNGDNGCLYNCYFENCYIPQSSYRSNGGAIQWWGINGNLFNCTFINCSASSSSSSSEGGAINWYGKNGILTNCIFQDCFALSKASSILGGGIYWQGSEGMINNCTFINCYTPNQSNPNSAGGSVYWYGNYGILSNSSFIGSSPSTVYWKASNGSLLDSTFYISSNQWDVYWDGSYGSIIGCNYSKLHSPSGCQVLQRSFIKMNSSYKIDVGDRFPLNYIINNNATGNIKIFLNNTFQTEIAVNEKFEFIDLKSGKYIIKIVYSGDNNFISCENSSELIVSKINTSLSVLPVNLNNDEMSLYIILSNKIPGNMTLFINQQNYSFNIVNGFVNMTLPHLSNGNYVYTIAYSGDEIYSPFLKNGTLTVNMVSETIIARDTIVEYGNEYNFNATFLNRDGTPLVNKYIIFEVDGSPFVTKTNSEGIAVLNENLTRGIYTITSINTKTDETKTNTFTVTGGPEPIKKSIIGASDITMNYGDVTYLVATLTDENEELIIGEEISIVLNGETIKNNTDANGQVKLLIDLTPANYTAIISFEGSEQYENSVKTIKIVVNKVDSYNVEIPDEIVNNDYTLSFDLPSDATGTVTISINNENFTTTVNNGNVNIMLPELTNGDYSYIITYSGDDKYLSFKKTGIINVNKPVHTIEWEDIVIDYGNDYEFKATFYNSNGTPLSNDYVVFEVNGVGHLVKTDSNGLAILKIGLSAGNYTIVSINMKTAETKINNLTVNALEPQPIDENDISIPSLDNHSSDGMFQIKLPNDATGTVTLSIGGKDYNFDVVNGVANVKVPDLANGAYSYSITYSGDGKYSSFTKTSKVTVNKPAPKPVTKTTLTLKKVKVKRSAKKLTIQATLKINGKAVKGKIIKFKFNKKSYKAKTNAKGVAKITVKKAVLKKLKKGKKVTYTVTYGKLTKKITVKVK